MARDESSLNNTSSYTKLINLMAIHNKNKVLKRYKQLYSPYAISHSTMVTSGHKTCENMAMTHRPIILPISRSGDNNNMSDSQGDEKDQFQGPHVSATPALMQTHRASST